MKILAIIAIVLGTGAVGTAVYSMAETHPNYKSARGRYLLGSAGSYRSGYGGHRNRLRSRMAALNNALYSSYESALKSQIILGPWAAGGLALILGVIAGIKKRRLGFVGAGLGALAVVLSFFVQPAHW